MPSVFPLDIVQKEDLPQRLLDLANEDPKYIIFAEDINKIKAGLNEINERFPRNVVTIGNWVVKKESDNEDYANIQVGDLLQGEPTSGRYIIGKVLSLPLDIDNEASVKLYYDGA